MTEAETHWFRVEDHVHGTGYVNEWGDFVSTGNVWEVKVRKLKVLSTTPKGVWLEAYFGKRFVLRSAKKRFACPTVKEAYVSFLRRKQIQLSYMKHRMDNLKKCVSIAERQMEAGVFSVPEPLFMEFT